MKLLRLLNLLIGYVDVYLPDLKYFYDESAVKFSHAPNYFKIATTAICEMFNQVGYPEFDDSGIIKRGVIIRHLALPGHITETKKVLEWIKNNLNESAYISLMTQYFPTYHANNFPEINRKLSTKEYNYILKFISTFKHGYIQELGEHEEEFVPDFNLDGV